MKFLKKLNVNFKDEVIKSTKGDKILPFFRVYQKLVQHNIINPFVYILIIIVEYLQLFYELTNDGEDYILNPTSEIKNSSAFSMYQILQYINFSHFIQKSYLSFQTFIILYIVVVCTIVINFLALIVLDVINKKYTGKKNQLWIFHVILGVFNYTNVKILIIPFNFVLIQSYSLDEFTSENVARDLFQSSEGLINQLTNASNPTSQGVTTFSSIGIKLISTIVIGMNLYTLINTSLLFNDLDPIESKLCWAQSYPEIEMYNINLKFFLVLFNILRGKFYFMKSIFVLVINLQRCTYRFFEWYYSWSVNKVLLIVLDFGFLFFNLLSFFLGSYNKQMDALIGFIVISGVFGLIFYVIIDHSQRSIIGKSISEFKDERHFCQLIIELIRIIKQLPQEEKSINESTFFGYLIKHKKVCQNEHCTTHIVNSFIYNSAALFQNEIESFIITKDDFNLYCKTNKRDNYDMLKDSKKIQCEKALYALIKCIIDLGISKLSKENTRFLPILEAYIYIHIFNNKFYALFQIMKYYKPDIHYREKFFFFMSLSNVLEKMVEENNLKFTSTASIMTVTDFYYYHEEFIKGMQHVLETGKNLFQKLVTMKPSAEEVLGQSIELGTGLKDLHVTFNKIMSMNPYEINILRIYTFMVEKLFSMKKVTSQNIIRLTQNIKFFLMNDKFKSNSDGTKSLDNPSKMALKNFQENSDSAVIIVSGILDNLGEILYCNNLVTSITGFEKKELMGFSMTSIVPQPVSVYHNKIILDFYRKGKRMTLDRVKNLFALHKNGTLVCIDLYVCFLPNMDYGLMFIGIFKNSYVINLSVDTRFNGPTERSEAEKERTGMTGIETQGEETEMIPNEGTMLKSQNLTQSKVPSKDLIRRMSFLKELSSTINPSNIRRLDLTNINRIIPKSLVYKVADTGIIFINSKFDILHLNTYACVNYLGLTKPLPVGKVPFKKICKEFPQKLTELENGEVIVTTIDVSGIGNMLNQMMSETTMMNTCNSDESLISLSRRKREVNPRKDQREKVVRMNMTKYSLGIANSEYYIITLQPNFINENLSADTDSDYSANQLIKEDSDLLNQTYQTISSFGGEIHLDENLTRPSYYSIEKQKQKLLNDSYMPGFTRVANVTIYILFLIIFIWVIVSYTIELGELQGITDELKLSTRNEMLSRSISYYVINSLLAIRGSLFPFANVNSLMPIIHNSMALEKENVYTILKLLTEDRTASDADKVRKNIAEDVNRYKDMSENNEIGENNLTMILGLNKLIHTIDFITNEQSNMTSAEFFNTKLYNRYKVKLFFIYQNYFPNFMNKLSYYSDILKVNFDENINAKRNTLLIIFILSLCFCIIVSVIIMITIYEQETSKKAFLRKLGNIPDPCFDDMVHLISAFEKSLALFLSEDKNIHLVKSKLEKDNLFKENFISADFFLKKDSIQIGNISSHSLGKAQTTAFTISPIGSPMRIGKRYGKEDNICEAQMGVENRYLSLRKTTIQQGQIPDLWVNNKRQSNISLKGMFGRRETKKGIEFGNEENGISPDKVVTQQENPANNIFHMKRRNTRRFTVTKPAKGKLVSKLDEENSDEEEEDEMRKTYTEYSIAWRKNILNFLISTVLITSYFIFSIVYLYAYFAEISKIVSATDLINRRVKAINNIIVSSNLILLYNQANIPNDQNLDLFSLAKQVADVESEFSKLVAWFSTNSNTYYTIVSYELANPCASFHGFKKTAYNLISCSDYQIPNGLSFQIIKNTNYLIEMYVNYYNKEGKDITAEYLEDMFNDPNLINIMIHNNFFCRLFLTDINFTYVQTYQQELQETMEIIHVKFTFYIILLLVLLLIYQIRLIPQITDLINNLMRVELFFDESIIDRKVN